MSSLYAYSPCLRLLVFFVFPNVVVMVISRLYTLFLEQQMLSSPASDPPYISSFLAAFFPNLTSSPFFLACHSSMFALNVLNQWWTMGIVGLPSTAGIATAVAAAVYCLCFQFTFLSLKSKKRKEVIEMDSEQSCNYSWLRFLRSSHGSCVLR